MRSHRARLVCPARSRRRRWTLLGALLIVGTAVIGAPLRQEPAQAAADPVADQALLVYEINRARWDPAGYEAERGSDTGGLLPRPPLAVSTYLTQSASFKSGEMADYHYFDHRSNVTGMWPNELVRAYGYPLPALFVNDANNVESLHAGSPVAANVLQSFADSPPHRSHIFGEDWFGTHVEIGVGRSSHENYWTVHTAFSDGPLRYVTGVVYADGNGNGRMDLGEGLGGISVDVGGTTVRTNSGGGWSAGVRPGAYFVRVRDGARFDGPSWATVRVSQWNVGVEFVSGVKRALVYEYRLCNGLEPTILGTSRDDLLIGTPGRDVIHGLGGDDTIDGLDGADVICGGAGNDVLLGRGGRDVLFGQAGADALDGGGNWDELRGGGGRDECRGGEDATACEVAVS